MGMSLTSFAQKEPPPPQTRNHRGGPPCIPQAEGNPNPGRPGVPPPPGLCLPIDDYVYLLMAIGVMYGCYKLRDVELT